MIRKVLLAAALVTALGSLAVAQRPGGGGGARGPGMGGMGGFGMQQPVNKLEAITNELKLTEAQQTDVAAILNDGAKQSNELLSKLAPIRSQVVNAAIKDADIAAQMKQITELTAQVTAVEVDTFTKIVAKLDDKQKSKAPKLFELMNHIYIQGTGGRGRGGR